MQNSRVTNDINETPDSSLTVNVQCVYPKLSRNLQLLWKVETHAVLAFPSR